MRKIIIVILLLLPLCLTAQGQAAHNWEVNVQGILGGRDGIAHGFGGEVAFLPLRTGPVHWGATVGAQRITAPFGHYVEYTQLIKTAYWFFPVMMTGEFLFGSVSLRRATPFISLSVGYAFSPDMKLTGKQDRVDHFNNSGFCFEPQVGLLFKRHFYASVGLWGQNLKQAIIDVDKNEEGGYAVPLVPIYLVDETPCHLLLAASLRLGVWF